jgi:hypothetical protein
MLQLALCIGAGSVLLASTKPRFVRWIARWWSMIQHSRVRISTTWVQLWQALHCSSRCLALHMVILGLCVAAWPWKPITWSSRLTVIVLTLLPSLELLNALTWRGVHILLDKCICVYASVVVVLHLTFCWFEICICIAIQRTRPSHIQYKPCFGRPIHYSCIFFSFLHCKVNSRF